MAASDSQNQADKGSLNGEYTDDVRQFVSEQNGSLLVDWRRISEISRQTNLLNLYHNVLKDLVSRRIFSESPRDNYQLLTIALTNANPCLPGAPLYFTRAEDARIFKEAHYPGSMFPSIHQNIESK